MSCAPRTSRKKTLTLPHVSAISTSDCEANAKCKCKHAKLRAARSHLAFCIWGILAFEQREHCLLVVEDKASLARCCASGGVGHVGFEADVAANGNSRDLTLSGDSPWPYCGPPLPGAGWHSVLRRLGSRILSARYRDDRFARSENALGGDEARRLRLHPEKPVDVRSSARAPAPFVQEYRELRF